MPLPLRKRRIRDACVSSLAFWASDIYSSGGKGASKFIPAKDCLRSRNYKVKVFLCSFGFPFTLGLKDPHAVVQSLAATMSCPAADVVVVLDRTLFLTCSHGNQSRRNTRVNDPAVVVSAIVVVGTSTHPWTWLHNDDADNCPCFPILQKCLRMVSDYRVRLPVLRFLRKILDPRLMCV